MTIGSIGPGEASLARELAHAALAVDPGGFDADVIAKARKPIERMFELAEDTVKL